MPAPCIFISSGEASGNLYAAQIARALKARRPELRLVGIASPEAEEAGVEAWAASRDLQIMGFTEIVRHLPRLMRLGRRLEARAVAENVQLFLPVDYPGFHIRLAGRLRRRGIPTLDFIPPKTWSWGRGRLKALRKNVEHCAVIFPFEVEHYGEAGVGATFVGHPLAELHSRVLSEPEPDREGLLLVPGSRRQELARLVMVLAELVDLLRADRPRLGIRVSRAPGVEAQRLSALVDRGVEIVDGPLIQELRRSAAAVVCSGTATVEAALSRTPHLIVYRTSPLTYAIARRLARVEHIGMANIILRKRAFPEFLQSEVKAPRLMAALRPLLVEPDEAMLEAQRIDSDELAARLGGPGCFDRVAEMALDRFDERCRALVPSA